MFLTRRFEEFHHRSKVQKRQGSRNGQVGQQLAPDYTGRVGETSPHKTSSNEGDDVMKPDSNHVQSTARETTVKAGPELRPQVSVAQPASNLNNHLLKSVTTQRTQGPV